MWRRILVPLLLSFLVACLTGVHVYVRGQGADYAGFLLFVNHLFDIIIVLAVLSICAGLGKRMLMWVRCVPATSLETLLFSTGVGCGVVSTVLLATGFLSGLQTITLTAILVALGCFARTEIIKLPGLVRHAAVEIRAGSNVFSLLIFGISAAFMISQALTPPADWDDLMYHLRVPSQFLEAGKIYLPEDNLHVAFVQLVHMLYLPLLAYGSTSGPALLSASFALLLGLAVFALSSRLFEGATTAFSLALVWGSTMVLLVGITARVDVTLAYYLFLAHFALLKSSHDWKSFYLCAVLLGFAIGVKHNAVIYTAALSPFIIWRAFSKNRSVTASTRYLICFGLLVAICSFPWMIKNWVLLEAPLYPFFVQRQLPSWLAFLYSKEETGALDPNVWTVLGEVRAPFNLTDFLLNPSALTVESEASFYHINPLLLGLILWLIYYRRDFNLNWLMIPALSYLIVVILFSSRTNLRYLMPIIAPFTIVAAHGMIGRLASVFGWKKAVVLFQVLLLLALIPSAKTMILWAIQKKTFAYATGAASMEEYLLDDVFPMGGYSGLAEIVSYVNRNISPEGKVLFLFEARGFYFDVPVIQDTVLTNWSLLANKASSLSCLKFTGISHVLLNRGALNYYLNRGLNPGTIQLDAFSHFAVECLTPIYENPGYILYSVRELPGTM